MATLFTNDVGELCVTLRGSAEDPVLTTLRGWPHWLRADIERDPHNTAHCLAVTLVTDRTHEPTMREILKRGFGMTFPEEGGSREVVLKPAARTRRRA